MQPECFLAQFSEKPCDGRLVRCHLVRQHTLKVELNASPEVLADPRSWVWGCGGPAGVSGHHGQFDARGCDPLRIPRDRLPVRFLEFCDELGLGWFVDREYGEALV